jgi:hypothetical protein
MKRAILLGIICLTIGFGGKAVLSGDITPNGMFQGDQFTFYSNVVTMSNELKGSVNASFTNSTAMETVINEIKADYNLLYANYTGLINKFDNMTSFAEQAAFDFSTNHDDSSAVAGVFQTATSTTSISTDDLTLTGL